jgi:hypothetical protein
VFVPDYLAAAEVQEDDKLGLKDVAHSLQHADPCVSSAVLRRGDGLRLLDATVAASPRDAALLSQPAHVMMRAAAQACGGVAERLASDIPGAPESIAGLARDCAQPPLRHVAPMRAVLESISRATAGEMLQSAGDPVSSPEVRAMRAVWRASPPTGRSSAAASAGAAASAPEDGEEGEVVSGDERAADAPEAVQAPLPWRAPHVEPQACFAMPDNGDANAMTSVRHARTGKVVAAEARALARQADDATAPSAQFPGWRADRALSPSERLPGTGFASSYDAGPPPQLFAHVATKLIKQVLLRDTKVEGAGHQNSLDFMHQGVVFRELRVSSASCYLRTLLMRVLDNLAGCFCCED